jgi:two-component sensor histidine kinase
VAVALWQLARLPHGFREHWCQELHSLAELASLRARLRERLVLIADELTSNALRHGGAPVATALSSAGDQWLLAVSDSSLDALPVPAQGRDPGLGGFGLYLVADLAAQHGWCPRQGAKTVWAVVDADEA